MKSLSESLENYARRPDNYATHLGEITVDYDGVYLEGTRIAEGDERVEGGGGFREVGGWGLEFYEEEEARRFDREVEALKGGGEEGVMRGIVNAFDVEEVVEGVRVVERRENVKRRYYEGVKIGRAHV